MFTKVGKCLGKRTTIIEIIASLLILLFIYTGLNKLIDYSNFRFQIGRSPFIQELKDWLAIPLPVCEILLALALVFKKTREFGLYMSFLMMFIFTGYIWLMLNYAPDLPCSCGGILQAMSWNDHLIFNASFTLLTLLAIILEFRSRQQGSIKSEI
jgi:hypothetical protein